MNNIIYSDGGSRGNPGEAAIGYVIYDNKMNLLYEEGRTIGVATNNHAEYTAMIEGLKKALALNMDSISLYLDSELVVRQITGQYKVKNSELMKLYEVAMNLISKLKSFEINHVKREKNKEADRILNIAMDTEKPYIQDNIQGSLNKTDGDSMISPDLEQKIDKLNQIINTYDSAVLAFSGGVDSTLLAVMASQILKDKLLCVTVDGDNMSREEISEAGKLAKSYNLNHKVLPMDIYQNKEFMVNDLERCFYCKKAIMDALTKEAEHFKANIIMDGSNLDDLSDYRPGRKALLQYHVQSPLVEAGFHKLDIREYSRFLGLPNAEKEAMACLVSRIPYHENINPVVLDQIEKSEKYLREMNYSNVRVRAFGNLAKIEMNPMDLKQFFDKNDYIKVDYALKKIGFQAVAVDLSGYETGKMNPINLKGEN